MRSLTVSEYRRLRARSSRRGLMATAGAAIGPRALIAAAMLMPVAATPIASGAWSPASAVVEVHSKTGIPVLSAAMLVGGPGYAYLRAAPGKAPAVEFPMLQEQWLDVFFGDKARLEAFVETTAISHGLPADFLAKLLRQESGLDHQAVSRAGALGVAQFMPATASERGLSDPFNPFEAIPKAAELLRDYRDRFGTLGLAAAAYNAGPQRVSKWLAGRSSLPRETRDYVQRITDLSAEDWRRGGDRSASSWAALIAR